MTYFLFHSIQSHLLKTGASWTWNLYSNFVIWGMLRNFSVPHQLYLYNDRNTYLIKLS